MTMSLPHTAVIQNVLLPLSPLSPSNTNIFSSSEYTPEDLENLQREHFLRRREASKKEKLSHLTLGHSVPRMIKCWANDYLWKDEIWYALSQVTYRCPTESVSNMIAKFRIRLKLKQSVATTTNVILVFNHMVNRKRKQEMGALLFGN